MFETHKPNTKTEQRGAGLVEYAILIALIAAVCLGGVAVLGESNRSLMESNASSIASSN